MTPARPARGGEDWVRYWRHQDLPLEAMHAHFVRHTYHRHSHDTYSFGVTEAGAQEFTCRGASHVSSAGMVMAFNPDDPHTGHAATERGFTYRMVHIGPELVADVLTDGMADANRRRASRPLFADPVIDAPELAARVRELHAALSGLASVLEQEERLTAAVTALAGRAATPPSPRPRPAVASALRIASDVRAYLHDSVHNGSAVRVTSREIANAAGTSRFSAYRAFRAAFGLSPGEYQRQLRLRAARRLLARGEPPASVAVDVGFADQAHFTRWFSRYYGVTPAAFQRAA